MVQLFSALFGGDRFEDYFGEVALIHAIKMQFDPVTRAAMPQDPAQQDQFVQDSIATAQLKRQETLIHKLLIKLEPFVCGEVQSWKDHVRFSRVGCALRS